MTMKQASKLGLSVLALGGALTMTGCSIASDHTETHSYATAAEGKSAKVVANWIPDDATDVQIKQDTTNNERVVRATYAGKLPKTCTAMATKGKPTVEERVKALKHEDSTTGGKFTPQELVEKQESAARLKADFYPEGTESQATDLCGKWWVSQSDGYLYAFTPNLKR
ncbi:hypothetical protein ACX8Z7_06920 [Glutamicibacter endophyticus]